MYQDVGDEVVTVFYDKNTRNCSSDVLDAAQVEFFGWIRELPSRLGSEYSTSDGALKFIPLSRNRYRLSFESRKEVEETVEC